MTKRLYRSMGESVILIWTLLVVSVCGQQHEVDTDRKFTIIVRYPYTKLQENGGKELYLRGNGLGYSTTQGSKLQNHGNDTWSITTTYKRSIDGYMCQDCGDTSLLPDDKFQYRILVDDAVDMIGANFAIKFPLSAASTYFDQVPEFTAYPWFYSKTGAPKLFSVTSTHIRGLRHLTMYQPPSFNENSYKTYPTMFAFDMGGVILPLKLLQDPIYPHNVIDEFILIGFADYSLWENDRTILLTQTAGPWFECINGTLADRCDDCFPENATAEELFHLLITKCARSTQLGGKGDDTLDFLLLEALPKASEMTSNRIDENRLGIMGYSLGGLMACYAAWTRPEIFKYGACQSPSFWWPYSQNFTDCDFDFVELTLKNESLWNNRPKQMLYLDAGGDEADPPTNLTQYTVKVAETISTNNMFTMNENLWVHISPGRQHSLDEFFRRLWKPLKIFFRAEGDTDLPESNSSVNSAVTLTNFSVFSISLFVFLTLLL